MEAYLDNSATTRCEKEVAELVTKLMLEDYGNPSSMHLKGVEAEKYIKEAKTRIAKTLKAKEKEIIFTSGGTESDNMALIGVAMANKRAGKHIITTEIEHAAIHSTAAYLEEMGFEITKIPVDNNGKIKREALEQALREDTILVSIMHVNNEVGAVEPVEEIAKLIKEKSPKAYFHVDAIQSYGKFKIVPKRMGIDLLSVSGHKIHGPKGIGFLYVNEKVKMNPIIFGGGQQSGMRSGTENVPGIAGLGLACEMAYESFDEKVERLYQLKEEFCEGLLKLEDVKINGIFDKTSAPQIVSASFKGIRSEVLLHTLEDRGIYISAGSACSSNKPAPSKTLLAMKVPKEELEATIRFSFSTHTTKGELDDTLEVLEEVLPKLRKYTRH
ncbi:MAG: cysteine desulfurase [Lachnospiraceae bacterium]|nr:cysteine desulfurase [Lachnospiraceae bacterium]